MKTPQTAWIFDIDGVITNLTTEKISQPEILDYLVKFLRQNEPVAFNTGRSIGWVEQEVLTPLKQKIQDQGLLQNLFVVTEKGGLWYTLNPDGTLNEHIDESLRVPIELDEQATKLIQEKYPESMVHESKRTMSTSKIRVGYPIGGYQKKQQELVEDLKKLIERLNLADKVIIDTTSIGTDIQSKSADKKRATGKILEWLAQNKIEPQRYIAFGDSFKSDTQIAQELNSQRLPVEFVYVGKEDIDISKYPFSITQTKNKFEKGTLEYLQSL